MKALACRITFFILLFAPLSSAALGSACEAAIKAIENRANQSGWQSLSEIKQDDKVEYLKWKGKYYVRKAGGRWILLSDNPEQEEKDILNKVKNGSLIYNCKLEGTKVVEGASTLIISYDVAMPGTNATNSKLFIGKSDGLPYIQEFDRVKVRYRYKNLDTPEHSLK